MPATEDPEPAGSEVFLTDFVISATKPVSFSSLFAYGQAEILDTEINVPQMEVIDRIRIY